VGTKENKKKKSSSNNPLHSPTKKEKMQGTLSVCLGFPSGCMKLLFLKEFITIFGLSFTLHKSNFFWLNLIGPSHKKKLKLRRLPKEEHPMERWSASPLAHIYK